MGLVSYCATVCIAPSLCLLCAKFGAFFANTDNDDDDDKPEANETLKRFAHPTPPQHTTWRPETSSSSA